MAEAHTLRPSDNPLVVTVQEGDYFDGGVEPGITLGTLRGATVLLYSRSAELATHTL